MNARLIYLKYTNLRALQKRRSEWLGPSPLRDQNMLKLKYKALRMLHTETLSPEEKSLLKEIV